MKDITYKKILVPHDGSKIASAALSDAAAIAKAFNSEIILIHVTVGLGEELAYIATGTLTPPLPIVVDQKALKEVRATAIKQLEKVKIRLAKIGVRKVSTVVEQGDASSLIVDTAKKHHCELIVMSTHGRSGLNRAVLGSVADYVIRHAKCPVLIVNPSKGGE